MRSRTWLSAAGTVTLTLLCLNFRLFEAPPPLTKPPSATHLGEATSPIATSAVSLPPTFNPIAQQKKQEATEESRFDKAIRLLTSPNRMINLSDDTLLARCDWSEKESGSNVKFMKEFGRIFRDLFDDLPWHLDEGGLIGAGRVGSMVNADDDFDFFAILPNQTEPCQRGTPHCTIREFDTFIHRFLSVFWNQGMCINKFHPDLSKFRSNGRLMYSFQLNRPRDVDPLKCFSEKVPFAHMHLGMLAEDGFLHTNIWVPKESTHSRDALPVEYMLPVRRCRAGPVDAPCPQNITGFLSVRNQGEYVKRSSDGNCLLVRSKWGLERKKAQVERVKKLDQCGYATMIDLVERFQTSNYRSC